VSDEEEEEEEVYRYDDDTFTDDSSSGGGNGKSQDETRLTVNCGRHLSRRLEGSDVSAASDNSGEDHKETDALLKERGRQQEMEWLLHNEPISDDDDTAARRAGRKIPATTTAASAGSVTAATDARALNTSMEGVDEEEQEVTVRKRGKFIHIAEIDFEDDFEAECLCDSEPSLRCVSVSVSVSVFVCVYVCDVECE